MRTENGVCENPALCSLPGAGAGGWEAGLSRCLKARAAHASYWLVGRAGFLWGYVRRVAAPSPLQPPVVGAGAAPPAPPARAGKCGRLTREWGGARREEGVRPRRGSAGCDSPAPPHFPSPQRPSEPRPAEAAPRGWQAGAFLWLSKSTVSSEWCSFGDNLEVGWVFFATSYSGKKPQIWCLGGV